MSWVPIHLSAADWSFAGGDGASIEGSTVTIEADAFHIVVTGALGVAEALRITVLSYHAEAGTEIIGTTSYAPAIFYNDGVGDDWRLLARNEAPPYPSTTLSSPYVVDEWTPSPTEEIELALGTANTIAYRTAAIQGGETGMVEGASFLFEVWVDDAPPGACFWTDLVNATQVCGGPPDPPEPTDAIQFYSPPGLGSGNGSLILRYMVGGDRSDYICSTALFAALTDGFPDVRITGYAPLGVPEEGYEGEFACGLGMDPESISFASVDWETTYSPGFVTEFYWYNDETLSQWTWYWVRIEVDEVAYYGAMLVGTGI